MQFEAVVNNQPAHVNGDVYSLYDPTYLKDPSVNGTSQTVYGTGVSKLVGGFQTSCPSGASGNVSYYAGTFTYSCFQFSLNSRGYVWIHTTGVWTFTITGADDAVILWAGQYAQQGWTKPNANISLAFSYKTGAPGTSFSVSLTQGTYLPIRLVSCQASGGAGYYFSIADPNGITLVDSNTAASPYVVQYSCDGTSAPKYAYLFGKEL